MENDHGPGRIQLWRMERWNSFNKKPFNTKLERYNDIFRGHAIAILKYFTVNAYIECARVCIAFLTREFQYRDTGYARGFIPMMNTSGKY